MTSPDVFLYVIIFAGSFLLSLFLTPAARHAALVLDINDLPSSAIKTHRTPVPYFGGVAIFLAFSLTLLWVRVLTSFPSGTLRSLRGILFGSVLIFVLGLVDDIKPKGLHYSTKFLFQISATLMVMIFGIHIKFIHPTWFALLLTVVWIVGLTNAFNLVDIMDGLAAGIALIACLAFLFISLPTEDIYVNVAATALSGSVLGFLPYNLSKNSRIFMGDSGSLLIGFVASSLALGTSYGGSNEVGVFAPLLILALPIFDTILVFSLRIRRGMSPFLGSKDHFALRLEILGWRRSRILLFSLGISLLFCSGAYLITRSDTPGALLIYALSASLLLLLTRYVLRAKLK